MIYSTDKIFICIKNNFISASVWHLNMAAVSLRLYAPQTSIPWLARPLKASLLPYIHVRTVGKHFNPSLNKNRVSLLQNVKCWSDLSDYWMRPLVSLGFKIAKKRSVCFHPFVCVVPPWNGTFTCNKTIKQVDKEQLEGNQMVLRFIRWHILGHLEPEAFAHPSRNRDSAARCSSRMTTSVNIDPSNLNSLLPVGVNSHLVALTHHLSAVGIPQPRADTGRIRDNSLLLSNHLFPRVSR